MIGRVLLWNAVDRSLGKVGMANYGKILEELRRERDLLGEAIVAMERLAAGQRGKRRGRPPKWLAAIKHGKEGQPAGQPAHVH